MTMPTAILAPDIGTTFKYHSHGKLSSFRVTAYQRRVRPEEIPPDTNESVGAMLTRVLYDGRSSDFVFCNRAEATHVSGTGVASCTAPIEEIEVTGHVNEAWSKELMDSAHKHAEWLIGQRDW